MGCPGPSRLDLALPGDLSSASVPLDARATQLGDDPRTAAIAPRDPNAAGLTWACRSPRGSPRDNRRTESATLSRAMRELEEWVRDVMVPVRKEHVDDG